MLVSSCDGSSTTYGSCIVRFEGIHLLSGNLKMRVTALYGTASASITATQTDGSPVRFRNAQVMVDATGKASDVLRRVQVRIPVLQNNEYAPSFAVQGSGSICKRYETYTTNTSSDLIIDPTLVTQGLSNLSGLTGSELGKDLCQ